MKIIQKSGKSPQEHIYTPWLTLEDAAAYCGIPVKTSRRINKAIPCPVTSGDNSNKRYYAPVVSQWLQDVQRITSAAPSASTFAYDSSPDGEE